MNELMAQQMKQNDTTIANVSNLFNRYNSLLNLE